MTIADVWQVLELLKRRQNSFGSFVIVIGETRMTVKKRSSRFVSVIGYPRINGKKRFESTTYLQSACCAWVWRALRHTSSRVQLLARGGADVPFSPDGEINGGRE